MKSYYSVFFAIFCLSACESPKVLIQKGDYDKAFDIYHSSLRGQKKGRQNPNDLRGLAYSFTMAQSRDSIQLAAVFAKKAADQWPQINALHRQIQARQKKVMALQPLQSKSGYKPHFLMFEAIDSLQKESRIQAASYLYAQAQSLLALTESSGQRLPAMEAYFTLRDLKTNYFPYWENANALIDSAHEAGKAHVMVERNTLQGVSDGSSFWEYMTVKPDFMYNDWFVFYQDSTTRKSFDYRVKCQLLSLYVGCENNTKTERVESKQVEDGYDETLDTAGHVTARSPRYKTETTTITTYASNRSANGTVLFELWDEHSGALLSTKALHGCHNFSETSEVFAPSAPTYWGMLIHVAGGVEWELKSELRKALLVER